MSSKTSSNRTRQEANRRLLGILSIVAVLMFGFGYALVPLYSLLCDVTGLNGKTGRIDAAAMQTEKVDTSRVVTVEFIGQTQSGLPWEFRPLQKKLQVTPGKVMVVNYYAKNLSTEVVTGQAVPSVAPNRAASHFKKVECFCFSQQTLQPGEERKMPVRFVVDTKLAKDVETITLSYAFFNIDKGQAKKYDGQDNHHHAHARPSDLVGKTVKINKL